MWLIYIRLSLYPTPAVKSSRLAVSDVLNYLRWFEEVFIVKFDFSFTTIRLASVSPATVVTWRIVYGKAIGWCSLVESSSWLFKLEEIDALKSEVSSLLALWSRTTSCNFCGY